MIQYSAQAVAQLQALYDHYEKLARPEAALALERAMGEAESFISLTPNLGLSAPRPYPQLRRIGWLWLHVHRYWVVYQPSPRPVIIAVFYDSANIPGRLK